MFHPRNPFVLQCITKLPDYLLDLFERQNLDIPFIITPIWDKKFALDVFHSKHAIVSAILHQHENNMHGIIVMKLLNQSLFISKQTSGVSLAKTEWPRAFLGGFVSWPSSSRRFVSWQRDDGTDEGLRENRPKASRCWLRELWPRREGRRGIVGVRRKEGLGEGEGRRVGKKKGHKTRVTVRSGKKGEIYRDLARPVEIR